MMKILLLVAVLVLFAVILLSVLNKKNRAAPAQANKDVEPPKRKTFMTPREEAMYNRLRDSLPQMAILAQVSFGALLSARSRAVRSSFDRKIADFIVCDKSLQVVAVIELDDGSHRAKEDKDRARDSLLTNAGYRVIRYSNVPDIEQLQRDFAVLRAVPSESQVPANTSLT